MFDYAPENRLVGKNCGKVVIFTQCSEIGGAVRSMVYPLPIPLNVLPPPCEFLNYGSLRQCRVNMTAVFQ
jgi:hypothetical protein